MSDSQLDQAKQYFNNPLRGDDLNTITDYKSVEEQQTFLLGSLDSPDDWIKYEAFRLEKRDKESERNLRRINAHRSFWFSLGWATFIGIFIAVKGFYKELSFTQTEYLITIGTLNVTILTYYLVVIKSLFPNNNNNNNNSKDES